MRKDIEKRHNQPRGTVNFCHRQSNTAACYHASASHPDQWREFRNGSEVFDGKTKKIFPLRGQASSNLRNCTFLLVYGTWPTVLMYTRCVIFNIFVYLYIYIFICVYI